MTAKPFTAIVVSETHWDRAWYLPFQVFRLRLVRLIDRLIDLLDQHPDYHSFMLDGQMLPVEDYLEIRPERRPDLERLVQAGRLSVGPWYALADEYLVSPEALIRNLLLGIRLAQSFGNGMREGYLPDSFGHISQMPQILSGFDIESAIFWRGFGDEGETLGNEFWWDAPDGSRVLAIHLRDGYHNVANLGYPTRGADTGAMQLDMALALRQIRDAVELLKPHAHTSLLLLLDGVDHAEATPDISTIIARANETLPDVTIEHGTLPDYIARTRREARGQALPAFSGEFNRGRYAHILQGVYSARMYLKQANEKVQTLLEKYAEPLSAWAWLLGAEYPSAFLWAAWRKLLQNHPHDDICGCSVDAVHREDMTRFGEAEQLAAAVARDSFRQIVNRIDRSAQAGIPFVVFNGTGWRRDETAAVALDFDQSDDTANNFHLVDAAGQPIPFQILNREQHFEMEVRKPVYKHRVQAAISLAGLPPCGYRVFFALPHSAPSAEQAGEAPPEIERPVEVLPNGMENQYLRVEINADGTLNLLDKTTQRQFRSLGYFIDDEDAGDEYDYSPCPQSQTPVLSVAERFSTLGEAARTCLEPSRKVQLIHSGPLQVSYEINLTLSLPASLAADRQGRSEQRVNCAIVSTVTLRRDSRRLEVRTVVDNQAKDHRLRVCFPSDITADQAVADGHFDVVSRPIDLPQTEGWIQAPVPTRHQRYFVDLSDGEAGLAIFNRGLPEYEILPDNGRNTIAVTLLRCVDIVFRDDIPTRPGYAGLPSPAPEAQCQGKHVFEYAIYPHAGNWQSVYREAYTFAAPLYLRRGDEREGYLPHQALPAGNPELDLYGPNTINPLDLSGDLPPECSFLTLEPETLVLSAVKRSEDGGSLIVRFYNPTAQTVQAILRFFQPLQAAREVNLNEDFQADLSVEGDTVSVTVGGKQVKTVALQYGD